MRPGSWYESWYEVLCGSWYGVLERSLVTKSWCEAFVGGGEQKSFAEFCSESYAGLGKVLCGVLCGLTRRQKLAVPPPKHSTDGFMVVFGPGPHESLMRSLGTTKTKIRNQGLGTTKAMHQDFRKTCTKTFTCGMSWYGSYAPGGFPRRSLMKVLSGILLDRIIFL